MGLPPRGSGSDDREETSTNQDSAPAAEGEAGEVEALQPHDALFREVFSDPGRAALVMRSCLPARVARHIDWDTLSLTQASMVPEGLKQRHGDLWYEAGVKQSDARVFLWVMYDHQSSVDRLMALRMARLALAQIDRWVRQQRKKPKKLPAILGFVLYNGARRWNAPTSLAELYDLPPEALADLRDHLLMFGFALDDLRATATEDIDARVPDPLARLALVAFKHGRAKNLPEQLVAHAEDIRQLLATDAGRANWILVAEYLCYVTPHHTPKTLAEELGTTISPEVEETMLTAGQRLMKEEYDKGRKDGRGDGQRDLVLDLLECRFGPVSKPIAEKIARAGAGELKDWAKRLLNAQSINDVFAS
jgi:hypothetical protein